MTDTTQPPAETLAGEALFAERLSYEDRILALEMQLVAAQKVLTKFATRVCGWDANHRFHATDSTQISHRIGDFREARSVLIRIDGYFDEQEKKS